MKLFEKYSKLRDKAFLLNLVSKDVYATMQLENQGVSKQKVDEIVLSVFKELELKGHKFSFD